MCNHARDLEPNHMRPCENLTTCNLETEECCSYGWIIYYDDICLGYMSHGMLGMHGMHGMHVSSGSQLQRPELYLHHL